MPSSPTPSMRNYSPTLTDMTVAYLQDDASFVGAAAAPFVPVKKDAATYYTYPQGEWQRMQMALRGSSQESEGGGWVHSTDSYNCIRYATHHDEDEVESASADEAFNVEEDNSQWLANQGKMHLDYLWQATVMLPATWTTDYDGVSTGPTPGAEFLHWNDSSADPQKDLQVLQSAIFALIGRFGNVMIVGADVHSAIITNTIVRASRNYNVDRDMAAMTNEALAAYFGLDKYIVARGIYNSANKGAAVSLGYLVNAKDMWLGYVNPSPGKKRMSAAYTFAYNEGGLGSDGMIARTIDMPLKTSRRYEIECYWNVKIISADAGAFVDDLVA